MATRVQSNWRLEFRIGLLQIDLLEMNKSCAVYSE